MHGLGDDHTLLGPIIDDIRVFVRRYDYVSMNLIRREGNAVAHRLALAGLRGTVVNAWVDHPPDSIIDLLLEEAPHLNI
ncbi:hypothetical protein C1H46_001086 [Malus baccata]|uniref:RNase H type-1 domain-containing protein n=1 Tax=Malus baccata TaxID=106549 RepID=A0A540NQI0_MALBA|nr:hypothetical protein C1H46_001086 [Malus baccata]